MTSITSSYAASISSGLSYLLKDSSSSSSDGTDDLYTLLKNSNGLHDYSLLKDGTGSAYIPTFDQLASATKTSTKLTLAKGISEAVLIQADASSRCGNASRVQDLTDQAQKVMDAVTEAVQNLTSNAKTADEAKKSCAAYQDTLSKTLSNLNTSLTEIKNLLKKADSATQESVSSTLSELDVAGHDIAKLSGVAWKSITGTSANTVSGYSSSTSASTTKTGTASLIDLLA